MMEEANRPEPRPGTPARSGRPFRGDPTSRTGGIRRSIALVAGLLALMLVGGALTAVLSGHGNNQVTQQQLTKQTVVAAGRSNRELPASLSALMGLETIHRNAPRFTLTDQHGHRVDLSRLVQHHEVVLAFMDDECRDICPLLAQELVDAHHDLGPAASKVDFVAVNVNAAHSSPASLRSFIARSGHGIGAVSTFTYLTGNPAALRRVWAHYDITVKVAQSGTVFHSEALYFIAPGGTMKYLATPFANQRPNGTGWLPASTVTRWGKGIARYAEAVLR